MNASCLRNLFRDQWLKTVCIVVVSGTIGFIAIASSAGRTPNGSVPMAVSAAVLGQCNPCGGGCGCPCTMSDCNGVCKKLSSCNLCCTSYWAATNAAICSGGCTQAM